MGLEAETQVKKVETIRNNLKLSGKKLAKLATDQQMDARKKGEIGRVIEATSGL